MSEAWDKLIDGKTPTHESLCAGWMCPACGLIREKDWGPDPCIGELPGVDFACCGHAGLVKDAFGYVAFSNGKIIRFAFAGRVDGVEVGL